ncbi:hypothetical protein KDJ56_16825 [Brevibacillus composti]|uniref:Uncharacterized protein n=1 Tax=Brevibacillus composti TaxID=2796470 RepID=A0A7T5EJ37_9BACL|nr:hypothetical protein [Brevibacillus composti]QQE73549.1 hypothetical protein JD108_16880 [Brevibacillus composti]QUO40631.1 hypothetical protein KDJ56_16825 [Brevibacillus composti]
MNTLLGRYIALLIASLVSILYFIWRNPDQHVLVVFVYSIVIVVVFFTVSIPVAFLADVLTERMKQIRWVVAALIQIFLTILVLTPILLIPLLLLYLRRSTELDFHLFLMFSSPFWKPVLFNSLLFWGVDEMVRAVQLRFCHRRI